MGATGRSGTVLIALAVILVALALVLPAIALMGGFDEVNPPPPETVLRIGFLDMVDSLNPHIGLNQAARFYFGLVYDSLQAYDADLQVTSNLAVDWSMVSSADPELVASGEPHGSVWEYNISGSAKWHDGRPFTADDVVWNLNLNCVGGNYTYAWTYMPYTCFMNYARKVDNDTVRVHFYDRTNGTPIPVAYGDMLPVYMLPRHLLEDQTTPYILFQWPGYFNSSDLVDRHTVGTGPFKAGPDIVNEFVKGDHLTLLRNDDYHWLTDKEMTINVDKITMSFYDDATAMKIALEVGELDIAQFPSDTFLEIWERTETGQIKNVDTHSGPAADQESVCIRFNTNPNGSYASAKWRCDVQVRRALAQAVNRDHIAEGIFNGTAHRNSGLFSPIDSDWYWTPSTSQELEYDLSAAAERLEDAGYRDTDSDGVRECTATSTAVLNGWSTEGDELNITVTGQTIHPEEKEIAQYLADQWAQIGVSLTYEKYALGIWPIIHPTSWSPEAMITSIRCEHDPCYALFEHSNLSFNAWSFDNAYTNTSYEENYRKSISELDVAQRREYVSDCVEALYEDVPLIVIADLSSNYAWRTDTFRNWGDWTLHPGLRIGALGGANALFFNLESAWPSPPKSSPGWPYAIAIACAGAATVVVFQLIRTRGPPEGT